MFYNIKVDIVYYRTNTDFELEFNLCGCCRMRLLTDKAPDKKTLVHDLARAVSRSRVIIISGNLFGEDGIMNITAHAISKTLVELNNKAYGISGDEKLQIISGSTPLVTPDGIFGGCIIESGPQTMVLLSDDRTVRKTIMNTLIHPYIEDIYAAELKNKADNQTIEPVAPAEDEVMDIMSNSDVQNVEPIPEPPVETTVELPEPEESVIITPVDETPEADVEPKKPIITFEENQDNDVILSGGMIFETDEHTIVPPKANDGLEESDLFVEPEKHRRGNVQFYNEKYFTDDKLDSPYHTDLDYSEQPKSMFSRNLPILIIAILLLIIIAVLCYCIFYVPAKDGVAATAYLQETFSTLFGK